MRRGGKTAKSKSAVGRWRLLGARREDRRAGCARLTMGAKPGTQGPPRDAHNRPLRALRAWGSVPSLAQAQRNLPRQNAKARSGAATPRSAIQPLKISYPSAENQLPDHQLFNQRGSDCRKDEYGSGTAMASRCVVAAGRIFYVHRGNSESPPDAVVTGMKKKGRKNRGSPPDGRQLTSAKAWAGGFCAALRRRRASPCTWPCRPRHRRGRSCTRRGPSTRRRPRR